MFRKNKPVVEEATGEAHDEREIFKFWDGMADRKIDPITAWRALINHKEINFAEECDMLVNDKIAEEIRSEATLSLIDLTREVFDVPAYDGHTDTGLTENETTELLNDFILYIDSIKKKLEILPARSRPSGSNGQETSTTKQDADSSSTKTESTDAEQQELSKA